MNWLLVQCNDMDHTIDFQGTNIYGHLLLSRTPQKRIAAPFLQHWLLKAKHTYTPALEHVQKPFFAKVSLIKQFYLFSNN